MLTTIKSASMTGAEGQPVNVEVHVADGLPGFTIISKGDAACREFRDRVRAAIISSGYEWPMKRITVNLAGPVHTSTRGLDLPAAIGVLAASEQIDLSRSERSVGLVGDLGLDGSVRRTPGVIPLAEALDTDDVVVPAADASGAAAVAGESVRSVQSLREVCDALSGEVPWPDPPPPSRQPANGSDGRDLSDVRCPEHALRAMEIAAAGGHNLLFVGPPGSGKSAMALRMDGILPDLTPEESLETSRVHSAAGLPLPDGLITRPPLRAPHHSASMAAMLGGGTTHTRPGEISAAHNGVLYLDDLAEFAPSVLDAVSQQPMREGRISVARANGLAVLPARFQLVGSTARCACAADDEASCTCSDGARARHARRLSGSFVDRMDVVVNVSRPDADERVTRTTAEVAERVAAARALARKRGVKCNSDLDGDQMAKCARLDDLSHQMLMDALSEGRMTARGLGSVKALARTIRDLEGGGAIQPSDIAEALDLRLASQPPRGSTEGFSAGTLRADAASRTATKCLAPTSNGGQCQHTVRGSETCAAGHQRRS